jgi:hypothetical protein
MDKPKRPPGSVFKRAFWNQYNVIFLGAAAMFAAVSGSWVPAIVGAGTEILWLVLGADSGPFRRWVDKQESKEAEARLRKELDRMLAGLDQSYLQRFQDLRQVAGEIETLAKENKGLETALVHDEMAKLGQLMHSFLKMAAVHQRLSGYLEANPATELERDIAHCQRGLKTEQDPRVQSSLRQALSLAQKRLRQYQQILGAWKALSVQMDTLEKSFDYLKSHILGIGTGDQLTAELDNLVTGVATVAELEASTDELMRDLRTAAAQQATVRQN